MIHLIEAKWHLRIDGNGYDEELKQKINLAEAIVCQYLGRVRGDTGDSDSTPPDVVLADAQRLTAAGAPDTMNAAVLLVLGELWAQREAGNANPLSPGVRLLLDGIKERGYA